MTAHELLTYLAAALVTIVAFQPAAEWLASFH